MHFFSFKYTVVGKCIKNKGNDEKPILVSLYFFSQYKVGKIQEQRKRVKNPYWYYQKVQNIGVYPSNCSSMQICECWSTKDFLFSKVIHTHTSVLWFLDFLYWTWMWKFNIFKWYAVFCQLNKIECSSMVLWLNVWVISIFRKEFLKGSTQAIQQRSANFLTIMD